MTLAAFEPWAHEPPLQRFATTLCELRPVDATFLGVHEFDDRWPDWSPDGHARLLAGFRELGSTLSNAAVGRPDPLAPPNWGAIDLNLAAAHCDLYAAELAGTHFTRGNPSLAMGEVAFGLIGLTIRDFAPAIERAGSLEARLRSVPAFLAGALATLREGSPPAAWRQKALVECEGVSAFLREGVGLWCDHVALPHVRQGAVTEAAQIALGGVHAFADALRLLPARGHESARACGPEHLHHCLVRGHWIDRPLDDVLHEARGRFAEVRSALREAVRSVGAATFAEVQDRLAQRHPPANDFYQAFATAWRGCYEVSQACELVTWPNEPIAYVPIPTWTRTAAPSLYYLYYRSPGPFDRYDRPYEYVVAPIDTVDPEGQARLLAVWNDSTIKLNHVVHHGALGHHVQNWYAARSPLLVGRVAAADCASRIAMLLGGTMAEGWACYATDLMDEFGFLTDDERVAEQHTRLRLLARAIIDLEFHMGLRTFDQAVDFYVSEVGMAFAAARAEAVKNSMFPGTAMMYWLGTKGIHELRTRVQEVRGADFSLRTFHDELLGFGSIPVALSSRLMLGPDA